MKIVVYAVFFMVVRVVAQSPFTIPPILLSTDTTECQAVAWGDYNGDGWDDLYISRGVESTGATATNFLYLNQSGTLVSQSMNGLTTLNDLSGSASWGDYNNDGYLDLYVAVVAPMSGKNNNLFMNDGAGAFIDKTGSADVGDISNDAEDSGYVGWGDYNNDGWLDMFVDNGKVFLEYPLKEINSFYENNAGVFTKKSASEIGNIVGTDDAYKTFRSGFTWCDYNNDGYSDIFNGSGYGSNNRMWKNDNGSGFINTFDFTQDLTSTRGICAGDFDNDGDFDFYLTSIIDGDRGVNFLYENRSTPTLDSLYIWPADKGEIVTNVNWSNSAIWSDFDNDGDLDLFVSNWGDADSGDVSHYFENSGYPDYNFSTQPGIIDTLNPKNGTNKGAGRGVASADFDHDGDLDLAVARTGCPLLYVNQTSGNNWVQVHLSGNGTTNTTAIGARVRIVANISAQGGRTSQLREISGQSGAGSQNSLTAHFGLGDATLIDTLEITWPVTGNKEIFTNLNVNQIYSYTETVVSGFANKANAPVGAFELYGNYPNPFNPLTTIHYKLAMANTVKLIIYNALGQGIKTLIKKRQEAGDYSVPFDASHLSSGVYYYKLTVGSFEDTRKMILIR